MSDIKTENLRFELNRPLLIMKAAKGFLACGYINPAICEKTGDACAIVSGVNDFDDMLKATVGAVSPAASALGVQVGDTGAAALQKLG